jgi:gas vesicle protein
MIDDERQGKTQWDLRQAKLELLGDLVQEKSLAYRELIKNKNKENLRNFFQEFQVVYKEVRQFANKNDQDQEKLLEEIEDMKTDLEKKLAERPGIDDFQLIDDTLETFQELDDLDDKLRRLQMEVGLDIPLKFEREGYGQADKTKKGGEK